jgi:hypothetical protein
LRVEKSDGELSPSPDTTGAGVVLEDGASVVEILEDEGALPVHELDVATRR